MPAEWKKAHDFAEVAEALGVNTDAVIGMVPDRIVLFTPEPGDVIYRASLGRDADGILRATPPVPLAPMADFESDVVSLFEQTVDEKGDGDGRKLD
jgi:hypothetical protein